MFGSVSEWVYRWLAGIQPDPEQPGFRKFKISPFLPSGLTFVNCTYESPYGLIRSDWKRTSSGVQFDITVPKGTTAIFNVPSEGKKSFTVTNSATQKTENLSATGSELITGLQEGSYMINY
jgi:alpha-L-rhamnosidase